MTGLKRNPEVMLEELLISIAKKLPAEISGMYNYIFKRSAKFGEEFSRAIFSYIGISRRGLRESDLEQLVNKYTNAEWDKLNFAAMRKYLRDQLIQSEDLGLWDFRHP